LPYGRVQPGDRLFFIQNKGDGMVRGSAFVSEVFNSEQLTKEQSAVLLKNNRCMLNLTAEQTKRWSGKRYLVLISVVDVHAIKPFPIDRSSYGNMDDWLPVGMIESVKK
jgi:hypothetical protein